MEHNENKNSGEELADDALDAVTGGVAPELSIALGGVMPCPCGASINVGTAQSVTCQCGRTWKLTAGGFWKARI